MVKTQGSSSEKLKILTKLKIQNITGCHGSLTELDDYSYNNVLNHKDIGIPSCQSQWVEAGEVYTV